MEQEGTLARVVQGVYLGAEHQRHPLAEAAAWTLRYPSAVIGLLTAATYHDLTDAFPRGTWLYVPKGTTVPRSTTSPVHVVQIAPHLVEPADDAENGIVTLNVHGVAVRITNADRTTIDLWRYPYRVSAEHALVALRRRTRAKGFSVPRFAHLAQRLDAWSTIEPVLQGMLVR